MAAVEEFVGARARLIRHYRSHGVPPAIIVTV
jgi:hypothetical protein